MSDTFDSVAFLSSVEGDGNWADEFLVFYQHGQWLSEERACAAFLAEKFAALQAFRSIVHERLELPANPEHGFVWTSLESHAIEEYGEQCVMADRASRAPAQDLHEFLGKMVRAEWVTWAREQPSPKASWLQPWEELTEPEREVDRRIGEAIWRFSYCRNVAPSARVPQAPADDVHALRAFAQSIIGDWPDVGGLDGFDLQQLGVKHWLLKLETRYAPCREEGCSCAEYADPSEWNEGVQCYRKTPLLTGATAIDGSINA